MPQITCSTTKTKPVKPRTEESQRDEMSQLAGRDAVTSRLRSKRAELDEELDAFLDELEDLLAETDAQAFVANYVQKGGE